LPNSMTAHHLASRSAHDPNLEPLSLGVPVTADHSVFFGVESNL
jgi:hypothetical protein